MKQIVTDESSIKDKITKIRSAVTKIHELDNTNIFENELFTNIAGSLYEVALDLIKEITNIDGLNDKQFEKFVDYLEGTEYKDIDEFLNYLEGEK